MLEIVCCKFTRLLISVATGMLVCGLSVAQSYPTKPMTLVVTYPPGAATDVFARVAARRMGELLGQQIVVLNRDGAGGATGTDVVAKAVGDGYTLLWGSSGPITISPVWAEKMPYDVMRDFAPVGLFAKIPFFLLAHPSVPAKTVKDVIALAKARPGKLNFASGGVGSQSHFAGEFFRSLAKIDIVHVPYRGTAISETELISGQVELGFASPTVTLRNTVQGRLRALATTGGQRSDMFPSVPTMAEAGVKGYEFIQWYGLLVPAKTPRDIVAILNATMNKSLEDPDVKKRIANEGGTASPNTADQFGAYLKAELVKNGKMIKDAGIRRE